MSCAQIKYTKTATYIKKFLGHTLSNGAFVVTYFIEHIRIVPPIRLDLYPQLQKNPVPQKLFHACARMGGYAFEHGAVFADYYALVAGFFAK